MELVSKPHILNNPPGIGAFGSKCDCDCHYYEEVRHITSCCRKQTKSVFVFSFKTGENIDKSMLKFLSSLPEDTEITRVDAREKGEVKVTFTANV